jgi:hypothetical protein
MKIRIAYFEALNGADDTTKDYDVELNEGETIVSVEAVLDGGYHTNWHRVYIQVPE